MEINTNSETTIFKLALNITMPWRIEKIEFNEEKELHIYIGYARGTKFECPKCHKTCNIHDTQEKVWRHLNFFEHKAYIHCKVPRIKCDDDKVLLVDVPWANSRTGFTMLFEKLVMQLARKMPVLSISKILNESNGKLWRIIKKYSSEYVNSIDCSKVTKIGLDETSRKGHDYITVFVDLDTSRVIYIAKGKKASTIEEFVTFFEEHNGDRKKVSDITCDMNMGFKNAMEKSFPNSKITFDKFHVMKIINEAVDDVRKNELKEQPILKESKYIWLKNTNKLSKVQKEKLQKMSKMNLKTGKAYRLKLAFQDIYNTNYTKDIAKLEIKEWIQWALRSNLIVFKNVAKTIASKLSGILNYFESKLTNAVLEGTNSMIQSIKSRARGYKVFDNFKAMVYLMNSEYSVIG